jgi:hypothetical protein
MVLRERNRDTALYAITDDAWPATRTGFQAWLAPETFDREDLPRRSLTNLIREARS